MSSAAALKNALTTMGTKVAGAPPKPEPIPEPIKSTQPSRRNTLPITVHFPADVRWQLKLLASEERRNVDDMVAEALNLLFTRYRKPEIAPRKALK